MKSEARAIEIRGLTKRFKPRRKLSRIWKRSEVVDAIRGIALDIDRGEIVSVIGPNGAGKTTLLKIIATLIAPTEGTVLVEGIDVARDPDRARDRLGYVLSDERSFFWRLSLRDNLRFFGALQGLSGKRARDRIGELAALLGLAGLLDKEFVDLSSGQRQRAAIARGLLSDPPIVLFDEATRSLDPGRAEHVRRVIRELLVERAKKAVLFATHDLEEARGLSHRTILMNEGLIVREGRFQDIEADILKLFREESEREESELFRLFPALKPGARASP